MARSFAHPAAPPDAEAGFLLPLSLTAGLILLLSSLSLSAMALQARQLQGAQRVRNQAEDQLASAAHSLAGALQGPYSCLLAIPSSQWQAGSLTAGCPAGLDPSQLQQLRIQDATVLLRHWQPSGHGNGGELWLQLGEQGPQHRYALTFAPALGLQEVA